MRQPIIELRKELIKDIEKYNTQNEHTLLMVLKEYVVLIDEVYEPQERQLIASCIVKSINYGKRIVLEEIKKKELIRKSKLEKIKKLIIWENMDSVSVGNGH